MTKEGKVTKEEATALDAVFNGLVEAQTIQTDRMVKSKSVAAASRASAAKSDANALKRILDRVKIGYYHAEV